MQPVDQFLVMSDKVKKDIQTLGSDKPIIKLTHPAYDNYGTEVSKEEAINHLGLSPKMTYLLFFGFVRKYKGLDLLINALADPLLENRAISLIIAGEFYDREQKYRRLIASKNLSKRVILHPNYIPNHDVKYYFSASDLVVLPYRSASQSGICQIASHFTRPVLISNVGGLPEIIEDGVNGFISSPEPALLAKGIQRFFDLQDKKELNQNIRVANESFSWSSFTSSFLRQIGHDFHTDKKLDSLLSSGVGV
jgi:glycosyltransferase involved in cell wall biosynthesis